MPLRRLFSLTNYPRDVMVLYAEGYSVTSFLVGQSNRSQFLGFIAQGMRGDWDGAARSYYRYNSVEELEQAWIQHLRDTRRPPTQLASSRGPAEVEPAGRVVVRQTVPPAQPLLEAPQPIYRGQAPGGDDGDPPPMPRRPAAGPGWSQPKPAWQPPPPPVQLGAPQFDAVPPAAVPRSPVGWSP